MRFSPDADARSLQYKAASRSTHFRQAILLLALFLAGVVVSVIIVRHVDPPRAHILKAPDKTGVVQTPNLPAEKLARELPA